MSALRIKGGCDATVRWDEVNDPATGVDELGGRLS